MTAIRRAVCHFNLQSDVSARLKYKVAANGRIQIIFIYRPPRTLLFLSYNNVIGRDLSRLLLLARIHFRKF